MCAVRLCHPCSGGALWTLLLILAAATCPLRCSEKSAAVVGKMYPRGNHWAVGHLMGKKSITSLPEQQQVYIDHLTLSQLDQDQTWERLSSAQQRLQTKLLHNSREKQRGKHLQEMLHLLLLTLKQEDNESI